MSIDLQLLAWAVGLTFLQMLVAVSGATLQVGLPTLVDNRDFMPKLHDWAGRAQRAHANMLENLALYAPLVLIAVAAGRTNETTALGGEIFLAGRLAYAFIYIAGIPYLRTAVWFVSVIGLIMIFSQLV
jgi:uncharacterized MAPEG superfamily protein